MSDQGVKAEARPGVQPPLVSETHCGSITEYTGVGAVVVATVGWAVTHLFAVRREIRKEKRAEVDACCKMCADLLAKARGYYATDGADSMARTYAAEIRFEFQRLLKRCERLQRWDKCFALQNALDQLMESLTGGEFESATRKVALPNSSLLVTIENDIHSLMDSLEAGFSKKFG